MSSSAVFVCELDRYLVTNYMDVLNLIGLFRGCHRNRYSKWFHYRWQHCMKMGSTSTKRATKG